MDGEEEVYRILNNFTQLTNAFLLFRLAVICMLNFNFKGETWNGLIQSSASHIYLRATFFPGQTHRLLLPC